ncbi:hypothetical protein FQA39_LY10039 [Lamprigera yunnana]|nr:hypothetical protein FQA39_LY10039 [Lamprigera yunnana]
MNFFVTNLVLACIISAVQVNGGLINGAAGGAVDPTKAMQQMGNAAMGAATQGVQQATQVGTQIVQQAVKAAQTAIQTGAQIAQQAVQAAAQAGQMAVQAMAQAAQSAGQLATQAASAGAAIGGGAAGGSAAGGGAAGGGSVKVGGSGQNSNEIKWDINTTKLLESEYAIRKELFRDAKTKKRPLWAEIQKTFEENGNHLSINILDTKLRNMEKTFKIMMDNNSKKNTGRDRITWIYYKDFVNIFKEDKTINFGHTITHSITRPTSAASSRSRSPTSTALQTSSISDDSGTNTPTSQNEFHDFSQ